jgi:hypothetical protein
MRYNDEVSRVLCSRVVGRRVLMRGGSWMTLICCSEREVVWTILGGPVYDYMAFRELGVDARRGV